MTQPELDVEDMKRLARQLLTPFLAGGGDPMVLRPAPDDYARVFVPAAAEQARAGYEEIWRQAPVPHPRPKAGQSELLVFAAPASLLTDDNELSRRFPGGYRGIAGLLDPHRIWFTWKFVAPGETSGMAYDGLVWLDGRFAWFPKPWRILGDGT